MKKIIYILILLNLLSCKESKIENSKKDNFEEIKEGKIIPEVEEIGKLYYPERMEQEQIKKNTGKNDYQYTLTNSDLLDTDLQNLKNHSKTIARYYYKFLIRINVPFNYDKIIVKIIHRNGKVDIFKYSEKEMKEIIKSDS